MLASTELGEAMPRAGTGPHDIRAVLTDEDRTRAVRLNDHPGVRIIPGVWLILVVAIAGCGSIDGLVNPPKPVVVQLEVWNRTLDPVFLLDLDGRRLDVPACGHAVAAQFLMNEVEIRTEDGFYFGTGTSGVGDSGRGQRMVITAAPGDSLAAANDQLVLPPCEGHPEIQADA